MVDGVANYLHFETCQWTSPRDSRCGLSKHGASAQDYNYASIRKNGSSDNVLNHTAFMNNTSDNTFYWGGLVSASASDTFEVYFSQSRGSAMNIEKNATSVFTYFGGFKVI